MRETSIEVYRQVEAEGLLTGLRSEVYKTLFHYGPLTQGECWKRYFGHRQRHDIAPRFAELEKRGVIKIVDKRPCGVTGRVVYAWDVTKDLPSAEEKKSVCPTCGKVSR